MGRGWGRRRRLGLRMEMGMEVEVEVGGLKGTGLEGREEGEGEGGGLLWFWGLFWGEWGGGEEEVRLSSGSSLGPWLWRGEGECVASVL